MTRLITEWRQVDWNPSTGPGVVFPILGSVSAARESVRTPTSMVRDQAEIDCPLGGATAGLATYTPRSTGSSPRSTAATRAAWSASV
jgi:hypothetical protein